MAYPLNNTFATAPAGGYLTTLGGMSVSYDATNEALNISASSSQSILRFNEPASTDFWFEADVEFLTDGIARKHLGLWVTTGNGSEGYRFAHIDNWWAVTRWNSGWGDQAQITDTRTDGAGTPTFNVGERRVLRCETVMGAFDAAGVPRAILLHFLVDGVLISQMTVAYYPGALIPGIFLYGATARVHSISGNTPSGLPTFPAAPLAAVRDLGLAFLPASDLWDRPGGYDFRFRGMETSRYSAYFSGPGFIAGTVREREPDQPLVRKVQLISEDTRVFVDEVWSDENGDYRFERLDPKQRYSVLCYDHTHHYRALIADNLTPEIPNA